jgi:hypothetical protein
MVTPNGCAPTLTVPLRTKVFASIIEMIVVAIGGHDQRARKTVIAQKNIAEGSRKSECLQS